MSGSTCSITASASGTVALTDDLDAALLVEDCPQTPTDDGKVIDDHDPSRHLRSRRARSRRGGVHRFP